MPQFFLLIKTPGYNSKGFRASGFECASALLQAACWPLFQRTPNRTRIQPGDRVAILATGDAKGRMILGMARVRATEEWKPAMHVDTPILLDGGIPATMLWLDQVRDFKPPILFDSVKEDLSFVPKKLKWGTVLARGARCISEADFRLLTSRRKAETMTKLAISAPA